jgi:hypothetical protein
MRGARFGSVEECSGAACSRFGRATHAPSSSTSSAPTSARTPAFFAAE